MKHVIDDHYLDNDSNLYRAVINVIDEVPVQVAVVDEKGDHVLDDDNNPTYDIEVQDRVVNQFDIVFAADDEQWKRKSPKSIAAEQRKQIKAALKEQQKMSVVSFVESDRESMPGIGEEL